MQTTIEGNIKAWYTGNYVWTLVCKYSPAPSCLPHSLCRKPRRHPPPYQILNQIPKFSRMKRPKCMFFRVVSTYLVHMYSSIKTIRIRCQNSAENRVSSNMTSLTTWYRTSPLMGRERTEIVTKTSHIHCNQSSTIIWICFLRTIEKRESYNWKLSSRLYFSASVHLDPRLLNDRANANPTSSHELDSVPLF